MVAQARKSGDKKGDLRELLDDYDAKIREAHEALRVEEAAKQKEAEAEGERGGVVGDGAAAEHAEGGEEGVHIDAAMDDDMGAAAAGDDDVEAVEAAAAAAGDDAMDVDDLQLGVAAAQVERRAPVPSMGRSPTPCLAAAAAAVIRVKEEPGLAAEESVVAPRRVKVSSQGRVHDGIRHEHARGRGYRADFHTSLSSLTCGPMLSDQAQGHQGRRRR